MSLVRVSGEIVKVGTGAVIIFSLFITWQSACAHDLARGALIFSRACSQCHGESGEGNGEYATATGVERPPRNLREGKFVFATDDKKMAELIRHGGGRFGLSGLMPPQHGLSDEDIADVVAFIRSLQVYSNAIQQ